MDFLKRAADRSTEAVEPLYSLSQAYRMLGNRTEAERYRRLADERRRRTSRDRAREWGQTLIRSLPATSARRVTGVVAMTMARIAPTQFRPGAASASRWWLPEQFMVVASRRKPTPSLDGLEPLLAARRFDEAEARIKDYLRNCTLRAIRPTC